MAEMMPYTSAPKLEELTEGGWRVCCYGCGVQTWNNMKYTREQAIAAWNTRRLANDQAHRSDALKPLKDK